MPPPDHRWEWTLPDGVKVAATLDSALRVESVFVGDRLASQATHGETRDGHVLDKPAGVVVKFQPGVLICILRVDGEEVSPNVWPVRKRAERPKPRVLSLPLRGVCIAIVALVLVGGGVWAWTNRSPAIERGPALGTTYRAENGRFVAHHPSRFVVRRAPLPAGTSGVVLVDAERDESIVIVACAGGDVPTDPWLAQKKLHPEAFVVVPKNGRLWEETSRNDETCVGKPGAVVGGKSTTARGEPALLWSCAFVHDGAAYLAMTSVRANASSEDARRLREIVEATELTHLAELQGQ